MPATLLYYCSVLALFTCRFHVFSAYPALVQTLKTLFLLHRAGEDGIRREDSTLPERFSGLITRLFGTDTDTGTNSSDRSSGNVGTTDNCSGGAVEKGKTEEQEGGLGGVEFLMSWQRRIAESEQFFSLMRSEGFLVHHHGKCIYSFFLP